MRISLLFAATLIGCGDDPAMVMPPEDTQTIALHAAGTKLLAIQPMGEAWQSLAVPGNGEVSATIPDGPFVLASVCDEADFFNYYLIYGGTGVAELDVHCGALANTVQVSMVEGSATRAAIGGYPFFGSISWWIKPGVYDVTAYDDTFSPPRVEIRRGVSITTDTVLSFDLATTGTPLERIEVTTDARETETLGKRARLHTARGTHMTLPADASDTHVYRVPASVLATGDRQTVTATAKNGAASRSATRTLPVTGDSMSVQLPAGLSSATAAFGPPQTATWTGGGDWNEAYFYAALPGLEVMFDAHVLPEYVAQTGPLTSIEMPVPASVPGWNPAWKIPNAADLEWSLKLDRHRADSENDSVEHTGTF